VKYGASTQPPTAPRRAAYERMATDTAQRAERARGLDVDGLEL